MVNYSKKSDAETLYNKTLVNPTVVKNFGENQSATLTFQNKTGIIALLSDIPAPPNLSNYSTKTGIETLTNKTIENPTITTHSSETINEFSSKSTNNYHLLMTLKL